MVPSRAEPALREHGGRDCGDGNMDGKYGRAPRCVLKPQQPPDTGLPRSFSSTKVMAIFPGRETLKYPILGAARQILFMYCIPATLGSCEWPTMKEEKKVENPLATYQTRARQEIRAL